MSSLAQQLGDQLAAGRPPARVLLVEDDHNDRDLFAQYSQHLHVTIIYAYDGAAALRLLELIPFPDVVVIDIRLPDCDGIELYSAIHHRWPKLSACLITGGSIDEYVARARAIGPARLLRKAEDLFNPQFMTKVLAEYGIREKQSPESRA